MRIKAFAFISVYMFYIVLAYSIGMQAETATRLPPTLFLIHY